jgi:DNA polymerase-3 subunit delta'
LKVINADSKKVDLLQNMLNELSQTHPTKIENLVELLNHIELIELLTFLQKWCIDLFMVYSGLNASLFPK